MVSTLVADPIACTSASDFLSVLLRGPLALYSSYLSDRKHPDRVYNSLPLRRKQTFAIKFAPNTPSTPAVIMTSFADSGTVIPLVPHSPPSNKIPTSDPCHIQTGISTCLPTSIFLNGRAIGPVVGFRGRTLPMHSLKFHVPPNQVGPISVDNPMPRPP